MIIKKSKLDLFKTVGLIFILAILATLIAERFISQGTILGYRVREVENPTALTSEQEQPSRACKQASVNDVSAVLEQDVERIASSIADQTKPLFKSLCSYITKGKNRRYVTIVIRQSKDESSAKTELEQLSKREGVQNKDSAYYSPISRQMTARDSDKILTVTVSEPSSEKYPTSADAASKILNQLR